MNFTAVILAGGRSTRMGRDKAWLLHEGKPLIEHSLRTVREAGAIEVAISCRAEQDFSRFECPILEDLNPDCGPLEGIERALETAEHPLVFILAVDLPGMTPAFIRWLHGKCSGASGAVVVRESGPEPLAAFYPRSAGQVACRMIASGQLAARAFADECVKQGFASAVSLSEEYETCLTNWNTPADLEP